MAIVLDGATHKWEAGAMDKAESGKAGKARKRVAARAASGPGDTAVSRVKSTIHLSLEASQRLDVHCTMASMDRSAMVEKLINDNLRRYVVSDRGGPGIALAEDTAPARESA